MMDSWVTAEVKHTDRHITSGLGLDFAGVVALCWEWDEAIQDSVDGDESIITFHLESGVTVQAHGMVARDIHAAWEEWRSHED